MTDNQTPNMQEEHDGKKTLSEEIEVAGNQLVDQVKRLVEQGNIRRLILRNADDNVIIEMPLTVGAVAGGAIVLAAPWLAALGAFAALVARVKIEIIREVADNDVVKPKNEE
jgi:hypothetical protein